MKRIAIVGAGQSGLQLALGLQSNGYDVTLLSNRTADQIRSGKVTSSQIMFDRAMRTERALGIDLWQEQTPQVNSLAIAVGNPLDRTSKIADWSGRFEQPAQSVDQRVKAAAWVELFATRGGRVQIAEAGVRELEELSDTHDLVVIAAGKGEIVNLFQRNAAQSMFDKPQRILGLLYVKGMKESPRPASGCIDVAPGVGEYVSFSALTTSGACDIMLFEGIPGTPMDCWDGIKTPDDYIRTAKRLLGTYFPWHSSRCESIELTDPNGAVSGRVTPTVRKPVSTLPSGRPIFGMADVVVVNDPISGQGANSAALCADLYLKEIIARGDRAFDAEWMKQTFDSFYSYAKYVASFTGTVLTGLPNVVNAMLSATNDPTLATAFASGLNDPRTFGSWLLDPPANAGLDQREAA